MGRSFSDNMGRGARIELRSAALSGEFGMKMLREKFVADADAILARLGVYSRGPRKGLPRGYIHWEKVVEGGFDYRVERRTVVRRGTQEWRVLENANPDSDDVSLVVAHDRIAAEDAAERARRAAMPPNEQCIERAMKMRKKAHQIMRDDGEFGREDFHYYMGRARKHLRDARELRA